MAKGDSGSFLDEMYQRAIDDAHEKGLMIIGSKIERDGMAVNVALDTMPAHEAWAIVINGCISQEEPIPLPYFLGYNKAIREKLNREDA